MQWGCDVTVRCYQYGFSRTLRVESHPPFYEQCQKDLNAFQLYNDPLFFLRLLLIAPGTIVESFFANTHVFNYSLHWPAQKLTGCLVAKDSLPQLRLLLSVNKPTAFCTR